MASTALLVAVIGAGLLLGDQLQADMALLTVKSSALHRGRVGKGLLFAFVVFALVGGAGAKRCDQVIPTLDVATTTRIVPSTCDEGGLYYSILIWKILCVPFFYKTISLRYRNFGCVPNRITVTAYSS